MRFSINLQLIARNGSIALARVIPERMDDNQHFGRRCRSGCPAAERERANPILIGIARRNGPNR